MIGSVVITILAAAAGPATPLRVATVPPPSPIIADQSPTTFDVVIAAGREPLWTSAVRVSQAGVNYTQVLRQANELCADSASQTDDAYRRSDSSSELNFTLNRRDIRRPDSFTITVRWQRPLKPCEGAGHRGATIEQMVDIAPGQTIRLDGDGSLSISLKRRQP